MVAATAGPCYCCCCFSSPPPQTFESLAARLAPTQRGGAAFTAANSADLLKPLSSLWSANSASSPSSRRGLRTWELLSGRSTPASMKAGLNLISERKLQCGASYCGRIWSRDTTQGNDRIWTRDTAQGDGRIWSRDTVQGNDRIWTRDNAQGDSRIWSRDTAQGNDRIWTRDTAQGDGRIWSRDTAQGNGSTDVHSAGTTSQAIAVLQNRLQGGLTTDSNKYVKVLQMCLKQKDLFAAKQVHDCIIQSGMDTNQYVAGNLLNVYIKCGGLVDARRVFDQLEKRSVIAWTNMIAGYAKSGHAESALELFNQMRQEGVEPNEITYLSILKVCTSPLALKWGKEIHECIRLAGFESDVRVGTALLKMYAKCGCIAEARRVFEKLTNRDVITWTVMIDGLAQHGCGDEAYRLFLQMRREGFKPNAFTWTVMIGGLAQHGCGHEAYQLFRQMRQEGFEPDAFTYASILNASGSSGALEWVKEVHGHASKAGLESDLRVGTALVRMYAESGNIDDARQVFNRMEKRDLVTWNVMICGLSRHGCGDEAYRLFLEMRQEGFQPDAFTYASILNASASEGALEWLKEVHGHARKAGLESDLRVGTALVHVYAKSGSLDDARLVFDRMQKRDIVTWNTIIGAYAEHCRGVEAYQLFLQMRREGLEPDAVIYMSILNASASVGSLEWVKEVHGHASKSGLESDLGVSNALVHMYAKSGNIDDARLVFDRMEKRDVITWNVMIGGLAQHGCGHEAYRLFRQMRQKGLEPDAFTYASILNASASAGALGWVKDVHGHASKAGLESDLRVGIALVHMYAESGNIDDARRVFDRKEKSDVVAWNVMIGGLAHHGCGREALAVFRKMNADLVKPNGTTFVAVL